jgi:hypothetical protein
MSSKYKVALDQKNRVYVGLFTTKELTDPYWTERFLSSKAFETEQEGILYLSNLDKDAITNERLRNAIVRYLDMKLPIGNVTNILDNAPPSLFGIDPVVSKFLEDWGRSVQVKLT